MEIKIILSKDEKNLLGVDETEFLEADALHLLFDATDLLTRNSDHLNMLRGNVPGVQSQLNKTWHENSILSGLVSGLHRITDTGYEPSL